MRMMAKSRKNSIVSENFPSFDSSEISAHLGEVGVSGEEDMEISSVFISFSDMKIGIGE